MNSLRALLRSTAVNDSTLTGLVEERFYPDEIALIENPTYPCINFSIGGGDGAERTAPKFHYPEIEFWTWSTVSKDEAWQVYQALFDVFEQQRLVSSEVYVVLFERSHPQETYDPIARAYGLYSRWGSTVSERV